MIITKSTFVFTTRIDFVLDGNDEFVELRELTTAEQNQVLTAGKMNSDGDFEDYVGMLAAAEKIFPKCIIDHSGVDEEGNKATNAALYEQLRQSSSLFQEILNTWMRAKRTDLSMKKTGSENPLV